MNEGTPNDPNTQLHWLVFEHASEAIVVFDAEGRVASANAAARELPTDFVDGLLAETSPWTRDLEPLRDDFRRLGRARAELCVGGRTFALEAAAVDSWRIVRIRDVSEQRRVEAELRALQRVQSLGHLTASLMHDLNNLLTPIHALGAYLEEELPPGAAQEAARDVRMAAEKGAALGRRTLQWMRSEPKRTNTVRVSTVVSEMRTLIERVVGNDVQVALAPACDTALASLDKEGLENALLNLAANARDAMPGGGRLTLRATRVSFDERSTGSRSGVGAGSYVALRVTDTGVGMKREVRERIFERFFTTKPVGHGTGLGLDAVRRFVRDSGGCIAVQSEEGCGTTISLFFPAIDSSPSQESGAPAAPWRREVEAVLDDDERATGAMGADRAGNPGPADERRGCPAGPL
jgi:signal transduction histidine kinase